MQTSLFVGAVTSCVAAASLSATTLFHDDFEGYPANSIIRTSGPWAAAAGADDYRMVRDGTTATPFGSPNQYARFADTGTTAGMLLMSANDPAPSGKVTTLSFDFHEPSTGGNGPLHFGYATTGADLNVAGSRLRLNFNDGVIGGVSGGAGSYSLNTAFTIYVIFNDTLSPVSYGARTVGAGSADVWLEPWGGDTPVYAGSAVATNSRTASYRIGFRCFDAHMQEVLVDNVRLATGITVPGTTPPSPAIIPSGHPRSQHVVEGSGLIVLAVAAIGEGPLTYQWKLNGADVPGATHSKLEIDTPDVAEAGDYTVVVSGPGGSTTSNPATVTLVNATLNLVDNFDLYGTGFLETLGTNWTVSLAGHYSVVASETGNQYLRCLDDDGQGTAPSIKPLGANAIAEGATSTFFSRFYFNDSTNGPFWYGLAAGATGGFEAYEGYLSFSSTGMIGIRDGGRATNATVGLTPDTWNNIWVVHNNKTDTYQIFLTDDDRAATLADRLTDPVGQHEFAFQNGTTGSISHVQIINRATTGAWGVDDMYMSPMVNLALPPPPPPRCLLTCSHPAVAKNGTVTLDWRASGLPPSSTFEITSEATLVFSNGSATGDAMVGSGRVNANLLSLPANLVRFSLIVRDDTGGTIVSSEVEAEVFDYSGPAKLPHPSVTSSAGQLAFMRNQVLNHPGSLARAGWNAMRGTSFASLAYVHTPQAVVSVAPGGSNASERAFRRDAHAARAHALQWAVTGDPAHRDKALNILSENGRAFETIVSTGQTIQTELESAWTLPVLLSAADIMRYHDGGSAGWDPADIASFNRFARILYDHAKRSMSRQSNWGVSASLAVMAYGAWSDDPVIFQPGLNNQRALLSSMSKTNGEIVETCRDTWHPQYSVITWIDSAELARNLGHLDLYEATFNSQSTPRLAIILEYFSKLMLGRATHPCGGSWAFDYVGEYRGFDNYEVAYNHYINRSNVAYLPVFAEMVEDFWRNNVGQDAHFLLWSRLTHGDNAYAALPAPETYEQWVAREFTAFGITDPLLTSPAADFNRDGSSNALRYWTLSNPRQANAEPLVSAAKVQVPGQLRVRVVERPDAASYGRTFLFSSDLEAWSETTPASIELVEDRNGQVLREATFPADGGRGFIRVSYPQP